MNQIEEVTNRQTRSTVRPIRNRTPLHQRKRRPTREGRASLEWRRGELNPRPETTRMMASTCLVRWFVVEPAADHRQPVAGSRPTVSRSGSKDRSARASSLKLRGSISVHRRPSETAVSRRYTPWIRQPSRTRERRNRRAQRLHHCHWQLMFVRIFNPAKQTSGACHHHRSHPVETDRPR
jgi:hypothetical protein